MISGRTRHHNKLLAVQLIVAITERRCDALRLKNKPSVNDLTFKEYPPRPNLTL